MQGNEIIEIPALHEIEDQIYIQNINMGHKTGRGDAPKLPSAFQKCSSKRHMFGCCRLFIMSISR